MIKTPIKRHYRIIAISCAAFVLILALLIWALSIGFTLSGNRFIDPLRSTLERAVGHQVAFDDAVSIRVSTHPRIEIKKLRLLNPPSFKSLNDKDGPNDFATIDRVVLAVDAWSLIRGQLIVEELTGDGAKIQLQRRLDGSNNWTPDPTLIDSDVKNAKSGEPTQGSTASSRAVAIELLQLRDVHIQFKNETKADKYFDLVDLTASASMTSALKLKAHGFVDKTHRYDIRFEGADAKQTLNNLINGPDPFKLEAGVQFLGSALNVSGDLEPINTKNTTQNNKDFVSRTQLVFGIGAPDVSEIDQFLDVKLPRFGAIALAGQIAPAGAGLAITGLQAALGKSQIGGDLLWDGRKLSGRLVAQILDMQPLLKKDASAEPSKSFSQWYLGLADAQFDLSLLTLLDADLTLGVKQWLAMPGDVQETELKIQLKDGRLSAPVKVLFAGVQMNGDLTINKQEFDIVLAAQDSPLGRIAEVFFGLDGIQGDLASLIMRANASGSRARELLDSMNVRLVLSRGKMRYGTKPGERPVSFGINSLALGAEQGAPTTIDSDFEVLGQPVIASGSTLPLNQLIARQSYPVDLIANSRSIKGSIKGTMEPTGRNTNLRVSLGAASTADLKHFISAGGASKTVTDPKKPKIPFQLNGRVKADKDGWRWDGEQAKIAGMAMKIDLSERAGVLTGAIDAPRISIPEIEAIIASLAQPKSPSSQTKDGSVASKSDDLNLEIPILPKKVSLKNSSFRVAIKQIVGSRINARDISMQIEIRDGHVLPSPFALTALDIPLTGAIGLDLRADTPSMEWWLQTQNANLGNALRELKVTQDTELQAGSLVLHAIARGDTLGRLLEQSEMTVELEKTRLEWRDKSTGVSAAFDIDKADLIAAPGKPINVTLNGSMDVPVAPNKVPMTLRLSTSRLEDLLNPTQRLPFSIQLQALDHQLDLQGSSARQVSQRDLQLKMQLSGSSMDKLDVLAKTALPPWGPYQLSGELQMARGGYTLPRMQLLVGAIGDNSQLNGKAQFDTSGVKPKLTAQLDATRIRLEDFELSNWSVFNKTKTIVVDTAPSSPLISRLSSAPSSSLNQDAIRLQAVKTATTVQGLLSPETLQRWDAQIDLNITNVSSGADNLGKANAKLTLQDGRAQLGPVQIDSLAGKAFAQLDYYPSKTDVDAHLTIQTDRFDYGILARRIDPKNTMYGKISVDLDIAGKAPDITQLASFGQGRVNFKVWPEKINAGVFDLWASNVLIALTEKVDGQSKINCGFGNFDLVNGTLTSKALWLDTSKVRVNGNARVNLKDEIIAVRVEPQPKSAQFFTLATPVEVSGTITDFKVSVQPGDILGTAGRFLTSWLWVPFQKLTGKALPADGADVCTAGIGVGLVQ